MSTESSKDEAWAAARRAWELDPKMGFPVIAERLGVSRQAVRKRAGNEGWVKRATVSGLALEAIARADESGVPMPDLPEVPGAPPRVAAEAADEVDARAEVLSRHRKEWMTARREIYEAMKNSDINKAKLGKMIADGLTVVHAGERKAWQLDAADGPAELRFIVERT